MGTGQVSWLSNWFMSIDPPVWEETSFKTVTNLKHSGGGSCLACTRWFVKDLIVVVPEPNAVIVVVDLTTDVEAVSENVNSSGKLRGIVDLTKAITTLKIGLLDL